MQKINCVTVSGTATSATAVHVVVPEYQKAKIVVRRFSALGNDAAAAVSWWIPRAGMSFNLYEEIEAADETINVPVDVAGGHVVKGHTLTTNDKILLPTSAGWKLLAISKVENVSGKMYCACTVAAVGADIPANTKAYILRAADKVSGVPAIGAAQVTVEDLLSGDSGAPVIAELVATTNKSALGCIFAEYWF